ncbi:hypothetical protein N9Y26_00700 [bacterium]|nr:hypothetical protein [bacterium]
MCADGLSCICQESELENSDYGNWLAPNGVALNYPIIVGGVGLSFDSLKSIMILLTPFNLLITFIVLIWANNNFSFNFLKVVFYIYLIGFFVEVLGVYSGDCPIYQAPASLLSKQGCSIGFGGAKVFTTRTDFYSFLVGRASPF